MPRGPAYVGWRWAVTLTRASRQKRVTIDEVVLLPGDDAIVAPEWVPYRERLKPGDLSPGDLLPVADDDPRLVPTYSFGDDPLDADDKAQIRDGRQGPRPGPGAHPLDRGPRPRRASAGTTARAAPTRRWPSRLRSRAAPAGSWSGSPGRSSETFGVCANGDANDDGRVVAFGHGCGAHSEVRLAKKHTPLPLPEHVFDTVTLDEFERSRPAPARALRRAPRAKGAPAAAVLQAEQAQAHPGTGTSTATRCGPSSSSRP